MESSREPIDLVLVDFDDTLVRTAPRFERARRNLFRLLESDGFAAGEVERVHHHEVDPVMRRDHGFGPHRLPMAFRETYNALCAAAGRTPDPETSAESERLGAGVAGTPPAIDGAVAALRRLVAVYPTVIYTQASDPDYQLGCVREAGAAAVVGEDRIRVVPRKTPAALREALTAFGVESPRRARMVGNSMRSDINPALDVGVPAILVEVEEPWQHDMVEPIGTGYRTVATFGAAVELLLEEAP